MGIVTGFFVISTSLVRIFLFFYHLKYIEITKLSLWGVALIIDLLFPLLGILMSYILKLPQEKTSFIILELISFATFFLTLGVYYHQKIVQSNVLWAIFFLFVAIWITELNSYLNTTNLSNFGHLTYTPIFCCIVNVIGVLIYWLGLFRKSALFFRKDPFFWISLGWFIFYLFISTTYIPITKNSEFVKNVIVGDVSLAGVLANICYCVAFWKSKNWVLKGFAKAT